MYWNVIIIRETQCVEIYFKPSDVVFVTCACRLPEGLVLDATWHVNLSWISVIICFLFLPSIFTLSLKYCVTTFGHIVEQLLSFLEVSSIQFFYRSVKDIRYTTVQFHINSVSSAKKEKLDLWATTVHKLPVCKVVAISTREVQG